MPTELKANEVPEESDPVGDGVRGRSNSSATLFPINSSLSDAGIGMFMMFGVGKDQGKGFISGAMKG